MNDFLNKLSKSLLETNELSERIQDLQTTYNISMKGILGIENQKKIQEMRTTYETSMKALNTTININDLVKQINKQQDSINTFAKNIKTTQTINNNIKIIPTISDKIKATQTINEGLFDSVFKQKNLWETYTSQIPAFNIPSEQNSTYEKEILCARLEYGDKSSFITVKENFFGEKIYEVSDNTQNFNKNNSQKIRLEEAEKKEFFEKNKSTTPIEDLFIYDELINFIEVEGENNEIKVSAYTYYNESWSFGKITHSKYETDSRCDVISYELVDFNYSNKTIYKKTCKKKKSLEAEIEGINALKGVIKTPEIFSRNKKTNSLRMNKIDSPLLHELLCKANQQQKEGALTNDEVSNYKLEILKPLIREISDIQTKGKNKQLKSFYGTLDEKNISEWFKEGFSRRINKLNDFEKEKPLIYSLEDIAIEYLQPLANSEKFYNKSPHPRNVFVTTEGFVHIDFESSCYAGMQNDLVILLEYEGTNLSDKEKTSLLQHFIDYTNKDEKIIKSNDEFIDTYCKTAFVRNLKSSVSRAEWASSHLKNLESIDNEEFEKSISLYEKGKEDMLNHLYQTIENPLIEHNHELVDKIINFSQYLIKTAEKPFQSSHIF
ncbi:hypothetical protein CMO90_03950 [Candidatus Woesearchaeota archaeon]|jgi:hypothetical protein|nr:hypothetical protein [Candidatus Woesearchaeota archaeon]